MTTLLPPNGLYIGLPSGQCFVQFFGSQYANCYLFFSPFAEEMNRSRRAIAQLGYSLSQRRIGLAVLDLFGTGDSAGEFADAFWESWLADSVVLTGKVRDRGYRLEGAIGLRFGAFLALATARASSLPRAVLWHPVRAGRSILTDLHRCIRIGAGAASRSDSTRPPEMPEAAPMQVAGYTIGPRLRADLAGLTLAGCAAGYEGQIDWISHQPGSGAEPRPPGRRTGAGPGFEAPITEHVIPGPHFWLLEDYRWPDFVAERVSAICARNVAVVEAGAGSPLSLASLGTSMQTAGGYGEEAVLIESGDQRLSAILTRPVGSARAIVLALSGGGQYRVGAHRYNVELARSLAASDIACLRFDCRGMGDSTGVHPGFERIGIDIGAAIRFASSLGTGPIFLFGLCDGATAIILSLARDKPSPAGAILANPWARSPETLAATQIRAYYGPRFLEQGFWTDLLAGRINIRRSCRELVASLWLALGPSRAASLPDRLRDAMEAVPVPTLVLLSDHDITAAEFDRSILARLRKESNGRKLRTRKVVAADHTFMSQDGRTAALEVMLDWLLQQLPRTATETCRAPIPAS